MFQIFRLLMTKEKHENCQFLHKFLINTNVLKNPGNFSEVPNFSANFQDFLRKQINTLAKTKEDIQKW